MTLGEKIKQARLDRKYTQKQLAELIGAKHNTISNWEKDQNKPNPDIIELLCGVLEVPPSYFFDADPEFSLSLVEQNLINKYRKLGVHGREVVTRIVELEYLHQLEIEDRKNHCPSEDPDTFTPHPVYLLPVSAGTGQFLDGENYEMVTFPTKEIPKGSNFGVRVSGDSMEPQLHDGDVAFIQRSKEIKSGSIGVFILNGEAYIKKMVCDLDECYLVSLNPSYQPIKIKETDDLKTVGKVLWVD